MLLHYEKPKKNKKIHHRRVHGTISYAKPSEGHSNLVR